MKRIFQSFVYVAAVLFPLAALPMGAPHREQPIRMSLAAPKQPLKVGKPLILHLTITNRSDHPIHISTSGGSYNVGKIYQVHVLDERGHPVPRRPPPPLPKPGQKGKFVIPGGSVPGFQLNSGESATDRVNVTYLYHLNRPGKYKMWIAERIYPGKGGLVKSNIITVTVVK